MEIGIVLPKDGVEVELVSAVFHVIETRYYDAERKLCFVELFLEALLKLVFLLVVVFFHGQPLFTRVLEPELSELFGHNQIFEGNVFGFHELNVEFVDGQEMLSMLLWIFLIDLFLSFDVVLPL
jgi:hypothetical protein